VGRTFPNRIAGISELYEGSRRVLWWLPQQRVQGQSSGSGRSASTEVVKLAWWSIELWKKCF